MLALGYKLIRIIHPHHEGRHYSANSIHMKISIYSVTKTTLMLDNKILTLHPQGKKGVNIDRDKYETLKNFILETVRSRGQISYQELNELGETTLTDSFPGSVPWYLVTVKLDLEARGLLERVPKTSPHELRLVEDT